VLDLKHAEGREALRRLVAGSDVLIENYRGDTMDRLGLGYEDLRRINGGLIYGAITGFGRTGPLAEQGGFDLIGQGMSGLMSVTGEGPGRPPVKVGPPVCDITAGILLAMGILAALAHRNRTGDGQMVDTSLFEAGITHTYWQSAIAFATGVAPGPMGSAHPLNAPYEALPTQDGWINVGAATQPTWKRFLAAIGAPELGADPRFADNVARMANRAALIAELSRRMQTRTTAEWLAALADTGCPAGPVLSITEMHAHAQTAARQMVPVVAHPVAGAVQTIGLPVKFSAAPGAVLHGSPRLGEHTRAVLGEFGYAPAEIEALLASGAAAGL
jgi:crotonobetainyl-CoA:carnitine CoA-transferase CaiB-like acyl-CoA transferase